MPLIDQKTQDVSLDFFLSQLCMRWEEIQWSTKSADNLTIRLANEVYSIYFEILDLVNKYKKPKDDHNNHRLLILGSKVGDIVDSIDGWVSELRSNGYDQQVLGYFEQLQERVVRRLY